MSLETLLLTSMVATVGGTAINIASARSEAASTAALARQEFAVLRNEAVQRRRMSAEEQHIMREDMQRTLKTQRALYAKSGVTMSGSPMQVQLQTVETMAEDIGMLAYIRETEARKLESGAGFSMMEAGAAQRLGKLRVGQTLFSGAGQLARDAMFLAKPKIGLGYRLS